MSKSGVYIRSGLLSLLFIHSALAAEVVRIVHIDSSGFPRIRMDVDIRSPHPANMTVMKSPELLLYEIYANQEKQVKGIQKQSRSHTEGILNLVLVLDTTRSIEPKVFAQFKKQARRLILGLDDNDRSAVYALQAQAHLLGDVSSRHRKQALKLEGVKRTGKRTRLYDALYSAMYTARSMASDTDEQHASKTSLVLFTDGKDEGSYLNDNDTFELTELGSRLEIPVYIFISPTLFAANDSKTGEQKNWRRLKRLALKTGGQIWPLPRRTAIKRSHDFIYAQQVLRYSLVWQSTADNLWPTDQVTLRAQLQHNESSFTAIDRYRVPLGAWIRNTYGRSTLLIYALLTVLLLGFGLLVLLVFLLYFRKQNSTMDGTDSTATAVESMPGETLEPYLQQPLESEFISRSQSSAARISRPPDVNRPDLHPAPVLMEDERRLYMREYNYRLLQEALREAGQYPAAALELLNHHESPKSRRYDLFLESTSLGSGRWSNIPIHDNTVSPIHARLKKVDQKFVLYDMLSAGGVYLNGRKLLRPRGLKDGDQIRIGRSHFRFRAVVK